MSPAQVLAFGMPGAAEWVVIMIIGLLLFGRRLPEIMRGLGSSVREFRSGMEGHLGGTSTPLPPRTEGHDRPVVSRIDDRPTPPPAAEATATGMSPETRNPS